MTWKTIAVAAIIQAIWILYVSRCLIKYRKWWQDLIGKTPFGFYPAPLPSPNRWDLMRQDSSCHIRVQLQCYIILPWGGNISDIGSLIWGLIFRVPLYWAWTVTLSVRPPPEVKVTSVTCAVGVSCVSRPPASFVRITEYLLTGKQLAVQGAYKITYRCDI